MQFLLNFLRQNKSLMSKYAVVGGIATIIDFSILYFLTDFVGFHYLLSATISFVFAALVNYNVNRRWTFRSNGKKRRQIPIFFIIATMGVIINNNILYIGVEFFALHYLLVKVFATGIVMVWNFLGNKYLTFRVK